MNKNLSSDEKIVTCFFSLFNPLIDNRVFNFKSECLVLSKDSILIILFNLRPN